MEITKAHGERELFVEEKLQSSSLRAGASPDLAKEVVRRVSRRLRPGTSSDSIYRQVVKTLQQAAPPIAARYSLKRAVMALGPTGYPFERFVSALLFEHGYRVTVGQMAVGRCVSHEIDVIARRSKELCMVECKYHNRPGGRCDVKVPLYIFARFLDVAHTWRQQEGGVAHVPWLITNTKVTSEAAAYSRCVGLRVTAWRYPEEAGLEKLIEDKKLYPVTVLQSLSPKTWTVLSRLNVVLARDLARADEQEIFRRTGLPLRLIRPLQLEARGL